MQILHLLLVLYRFNALLTRRERQRVC
jgi:hypothetical protein